MNSLEIQRPRVSSSLVHDAFREVAAGNADRVAVSGKEPLTYREVETLASKCASAISKASGAERGPVAMCLEKDGRLPALFLGVAQTGRPYLYLDPSDPPAYRNALIEKTASSLLITNEDGVDAKVAKLSVDDILRDEGTTLVVNELIEPSSPFCLLQTGGTTREPRCVSVSHRTLLHNIGNYRHALSIHAEDRLSLLASAKFAAANSAIYGALLSGACVCPFDLRAEGFSPWIEWIGREEITILHTTPSLFRLLARYVDREFFPKLRAIKLGGEPVNRKDVELYRQNISPSCVLINGLGMSEAGGNVCHHFIRHDSPPILDRDLVPVGTALTGHSLAIINADGASVRQGEEGEIVVKSAFLSDGYWNDGEATAAKFSPADESGERVLRTGDRGRLLPDGSLVHLGRSDRLIKIRGNRVDLNLVEAAFMGLAGVRNAAVHYAEIPGLLVACIQPGEASATDAASVRASLANTLPDFMIPQRILFMRVLPLTDGGKVDRRKLLTALGRDFSKKADVAPRTITEQRLTEMWRRVLRRENIGIYDNFFELGGSSLQALEFIALLSVELGACCWSGLLLVRPTIAQIAEGIEEGAVQIRESAGARLELTRKSQELEPSLLPLRRGGTGAPIVFFPGGYGSENELVVFATLAPYIHKRHPIWGIRLNLLTKDLRRPRSLGEIAGMISKMLIERFDVMPILVGECHASALALETARCMRSFINEDPAVILLDPLQPRAKGPRSAAPEHRAAIVRYYRLLGTYRPGRYDGAIDIVCCAASARSPEACREWWSQGTQTECQLHIVPGNHLSYLRQDKAHLAETLNTLCDSKRIVSRIGKWLRRTWKEFRP